MPGPARRPLHCPAHHDCEIWAEETRQSLDDRTHSDWLHEEVSVMWTAFWAWVGTTTARFRACTTIGPVRIPHPDDGRTEIAVSLLDPTTAHLLASYSRFGRTEAAGAYMCFVAQTPSGIWKAVSGFFLAWCAPCDPGGEQTMRTFRRGLPDLGMHATSIWDLPEGLRPGPGWFDGVDGAADRLIFGARVRLDLPGVWEPGPANGSTAALVATGPVTSTLANIVFLDDAQRQSPHLDRLRGPAERWWHRTGPAADLVRISGLNTERGVPPVEARVRAETARTRGA